MRYPAIMVVLVFLIGVGSGCQLRGEKQSTTRNGSIIWEEQSPGVAYHTETVTADGIDFEMHIARINPDEVRWQVLYEPGMALNYIEWKSRLGRTVKAFINANFFTEQDVAIGLVAANGQVFGRTLNGYGGMFQVDAAGIVRVRSLVSEPYMSGTLQYAVQSFPMLIEPGGVPASTGPGFNDPTRRSAIGQDAAGNIYLFSTGLLGQISLENLQGWLLNSDLNLDVAFALDGGRSSMLFVNGTDPVEVPGLAAVPVILAVY